jgi:hypothetical protein
MTVYIDDTPTHRRGRAWFHLVSDDPTDEDLHALANVIGLRRGWYQGDHYDVTGSKALLAVEKGAVEVSSRKVVEVLKASGKR